MQTVGKSVVMPVWNRIRCARRQWLGEALLLVLVLLFYARTWRFSYLAWDDTRFLLENSLIRSFSLAHLQAILTPGAIKGEWLYVPFFYFSYAVERLLFGITPVASHLINVLLHAANGILVFHFFRRLSGNRWASWFAAVLFILHPLQVEAVAWCMGRKDLLAAFFALLALLLCAKKASPKLSEKTAGEELNRDFSLILISVSGIAAMLCKPTLCILPLLLVLVDRFVGRKPLGRSLYRYLPLFLAATLVLAVNLSLAPKTGGMNFNNLSRLWWLPALAAGWLRRLLLLEPSKIIYLPQTVASAAFSFWSWGLFLVALGGLGWLIYRRERAACFGIAFFLLAMIPQANILLSSKIFVTADRFGYFPLIGLFFLLTRFLVGPWPRVRFGIVVGFLFIAAWQTNRQINIWQNTFRLWTYESRSAPEDMIAWTGLGREALKQKKAEAAYRAFQTAVAVAPFYAGARLLLAKSLEQRGDKAGAGRQLQWAVRIEPEDPDVWFALADFHLRNQGMAAAQKAIRQLRRLAPVYPRLELALGEYFYKQSRFQDALEHFLAAVDQDPAYVPAWHNAGVTWQRLGNERSAQYCFQRAAAAGATSRKF